MGGFFFSKGVVGCLIASDFEVDILDGAGRKHNCSLCRCDCVEHCFEGLSCWEVAVCQ